MTPYDGEPPRTGEQTLPPDLDPRRGRTPPEAPPPRRRRRKLPWILGGTGGVIAVVVIVFVALVWVALGKIAHVCVFCGYQQVGDAASGDLNILVVGSDSRAGLTAAQQKALHVGNVAGQRTDTMLLVHIPAGSGKAVIVSLPRDSYVTIPAHTVGGHRVPAQKNKLNAAFALGGANLLTHTVEDATGVHIDHYVQINFSGFVNIVNALGGVTVCTNTPIHDPIRRNPDGSGWIGSGLNLPAGSSHLDGVRALEYVRAREFDPTEDIGRMRRQQEFIADVMHRAESLGVLLNPVKLHSVLDAATSSLTTDAGLSGGTLFSLIWRLHTMSPANVQELTVPLANPSNPSMIKDIGGVGQSVVEWDPRESRVLFSDLEHDQPVDNLVGPHRVPIAPSSIALKVLNATSHTGLAAKAAAALSARGFSISGTGNAPAGTDPATTVVRYGSNRAQSAQTVAASVPGAVKQLDPKLGAEGLELLVGQNYHGTAAVKVASNAPQINTAAGKQCQTA